MPTPRPCPSSSSCPATQRLVSLARRVARILLLAGLAAPWTSPKLDGWEAQARPAGQAPRDPDEVDHLAMAAMLARDGHDDRASAALQQVDPAAPGVDLKLYHSLSGLLALKAQRHEQAVDHLDRAIAAGQTEDTVFIYLAQAYFALERWDRVVLSVKNADEAGRRIPELALMRAHAERALERPIDAWRTLEAAATRHPDHPALLRQQTFALIELGLYQAAQELQARYLSRITPEAADYIALALAFERGGQSEQAIKLLEQGRLRLGPTRELTLRLALAYSEAQMPLAAAELLQWSSEDHPELLTQAVELMRQARATERALGLNARVNDQPAKLKQLTAILIDAQRFEQAAALEPRLQRLGLLSDQHLVYALAYARLKIADYVGAEALIKRISDPALFEHATQLRRMIALCERDPMTCQG